MGKSVILFMCFVTLASAYWSPFWNDEPASNQYQNKTEVLERNETMVNETKSNIPDLVSLARKLNLTKFVQHLESSNLHKVLDHERYFTVFAPSDVAFDQAPFYCRYQPEEQQMRFLVARGMHPTTSFKNDLRLRTLLSHRELRINLYDDGKVITASGMKLGRSDFKARNGMIHIIDDIATCTLPKSNAVQEINSCPNLRAMAAAINKTRLYKVFNKTDPMTIFVPTNRAFDKLPSEFRRMMFDSTEMLRKIVMYHVIPRSLFTEGMVDNQQVKTMEGSRLNITRTYDNDVTVNCATITSRDLNVFNGVIHGIDRVLIPHHIISDYGLHNVTEI